jgi:hypothetical protein
MKKIIMDNIRKVRLDHIAFLIVMGSEASDGYLYFRSIAKKKAKDILRYKNRS